MVDFNNESTVATPPGDVVKIVMLERREQVIETLESYHEKKANGNSMKEDLSLIKARVMALWYELQGIARRRLKPKEYDLIEKGMMDAKEWTELQAAFQWMNEFVDGLGLTYIDTRNKYDRTRVEDTNTKRGM